MACGNSVTHFMRTGAPILLRFRRLLWLAGFALVAATALGEPVATYRNDGDVFNPQINATSAVNAGRIETFTGSAMFQPLDLVNFANLFGATIVGNPGLRFDFLSSTTGLRSPSASFVNRGLIAISGDPLASIGLQTNTAGTAFANSGGRLLVTATSIDVNSGTLVAGAEGLVRLVGTTVDAGFSRMQIGGMENLFFPGLAGRTNFLNPTFVKDIYWAAGTNQVMNTNTGAPLFLGSGQPFGSVPLISAPIHQVEPRSVGFATVPEVVGTPFEPFVYITQVNATSQVVQVVFLATNRLDTNLTASVQFEPRGAGAVPIVAFASRSFSFSAAQFVTNTVYFTDSTLFLTNNTVVENFADLSFRPQTYEISRALPGILGFGLPPNAPYSSVIFYQPGYSNIFVTNRYSAYRAEIGVNPFATNYSSFNPGLSDPTNSGGRVELIGDNLNLGGAAIHAETSITIKTSNLTGIQSAILDAPIINYDLVDSSPSLALTNIVPASVSRINGRLSAWSGSWSNRDGNTNAPMTLTYHVLILDASQLRSSQAVASPSLVIRATNVQLETTLNASRTFTLDASAVSFNSSNRLVLSSNFFPVLGVTNFPRLTAFTNAGFIFVPGEARFGSDRTLPLASVVNRGSNAFISAVAQFIRADSFENGGALEARTGPISVQAASAKLENGSLSAGSDILLSGANLKVRTHDFRTAGRLILNVTSSLTDLGADAANTWRVAFGFRMDAKPASGNLLGTAITTVIPPFSEVPHVWGAADLGPTEAGYSNNFAIGRLVINGDSTSRAVFSGLTPGSALYVDYLDLTGAGTNLSLLTNVLAINPGMTLYCAGASVPVDKLDGQFGGRLRWVRDYAGANSSADALLPDGRSVKVNAALLSSALLDSDADGIPNQFDVSPFDGVQLQPMLTFTNLPVRSVLISWESAALTVYRVETNSFATPLMWGLLRFYTNSTLFNSLATVQDPVPPNGSPRFYRVLYSP